MPITKTVSLTNFDEKDVAAAEDILTKICKEAMTESEVETQVLALISAVGGVPFVLECRTSDPASPTTGRIWLRTDL